MTRFPTQFVSSRSAYMSSAYFPTAQLADNARRALEGVAYDTLVGTGLSGALVIPRLAEALGARWLIVRKPGVSTHSTRPAEGDLGQRWLFVDDFVTTGETRGRVLEAVERLSRHHDHDTVYAGDYLYAENDYRPPAAQPDEEPVPPQPSFSGGVLPPRFAPGFDPTLMPKLGAPVPYELNNRY